MVSFTVEQPLTVADIRYTLSAVSPRSRNPNTKSQYAVPPPYPRETAACTIWNLPHIAKYHAIIADLQHRKAVAGRLRNPSAHPTPTYAQFMDFAETVSLRHDSVFAPIMNGLEQGVNPYSVLILLLNEQLSLRTRLGYLDFWRNSANSSFFLTCFLYGAQVGEINHHSYELAAIRAAPYARSHYL